MTDTQEAKTQKFKCNSCGRKKLKKPSPFDCCDACMKTLNSAQEDKFQ